ncbi:uncharacterized protein LOC128133075 [Lactuca sativa]|uniref:F-box/LRR-repeat protein 15/At3g58940/PEG3-like LRR domain-containing protein n=1 Tax=Lactuca sativa TaxID=4236 RepID=A0A9R1W3W2_LACSA|nr:uncharacterized protein LOC128133075 [Lactuca sativa]KAJ0215715.1 hypothetical protein LSAT_V11C300144890 [Lactuca sativa]
MKLVDVDNTLIRYLRDNKPIERFDLMIDIENQESASHAEKWIGTKNKTCLKEFILSTNLYGASFTLPDELLLCENLTKIRVSATKGIHSVLMTTSQHQHPVIINCFSLRELHSDGVRISEEILHDILSSCSLLVKIELLNSCEGVKTIKVKKLQRLYELRIHLYHEDVHSTPLEISDLPNLGVFSCNLRPRQWLNPHPCLFNSHSISLGSSVTELMLGGVILDKERVDMIKSEFPFLESLTLHMTSWMLGSFHFTCASIKRLYLLLCPDILIDVQVYAPKLLFFPVQRRHIA